MMNFKTNVRAILESHFSGFQEEIIDSATKRICEIKTSKGDIPCKKLTRKVWEFYCSYCNATLRECDNYCSWCGRKITENKKEKKEIEF